MSGQENENAGLDMAAPAEGLSDETQKLNMEVDVQVTGDCKRHVIVTVSLEDVQRYFQVRFDELMPRAEVPGFRPGKAPRKLIESKFRKSVSEQVKGNLVLDALTQIGDDDHFSAIGEPDFDFDAVQLEENAPLQFEFDIEVRPEFELPQWKGLQLERLTHEFTPEEIDQKAVHFLRRKGRVQPVNGPVQAQDVVVVSVCSLVDGQVVNEIDELTMDVFPSASFRDASIPEFDQLLVGRSAGDEVETNVTFSESAANLVVRGKQGVVKIKILDVKRHDTTELNSETVKLFGDKFKDPGEVRDAIKTELQNQLIYQQNKRVREQITSLLTESANWELPPELLERQSRRELERAVLELRRNGLSEDYITAYENNLRQNSKEQTKLALKEHFILERIAEVENIEDTPEDYDHEIALIAASMNDSARRVRSRLEKAGQMDSLRNQIVERKVLALIEEHARFNAIPFEIPNEPVAAVDVALGGRLAAEIPEAKSDYVAPVNASGKGDHVAPRSGR